MDAQTNRLDNIAGVSAAVAAMPTEQRVLLSDGREVTVGRLSWLQFEALWQELAPLLAALIAAGETPDPSALTAQLAQAPPVVVSLCLLTAPLSEPELVALPYGDVLSVAAAALRLNFAEGAGVRSFFGVLGRLANPGEYAQAPPESAAPAPPVP